MVVLLVMLLGEFVVMMSWVVLVIGVDMGMVYLLYVLWCLMVMIFVVILCVYFGIGGVLYVLLIGEFGVVLSVDDVMKVIDIVGLVYDVLLVWVVV